MDDGYMLGASILVNPVYEENARDKSVYFPGNEAC
jgi:alpha-glucosidase (family GH31 glycosyl hydrolase)